MLASRQQTSVLDLIQGLTQAGVLQGSCTASLLGHGEDSRAPPPVAVNLRPLNLEMGLGPAPFQGPLFISGPGLSTASFTVTLAGPPTPTAVFCLSQFVSGGSWRPRWPGCL